MKEWFLEVLLVLAHSTKAQAAIWVACLGFVGIHFYGSYATESFELHGYLSPLSEVVREKLAHRYDKVALLWFVTFAVAAIKAYRKECKRLFGL